jgi:hypothetical protein
MCRLHGVRVALLSLALWSLSGCFYIPGPEKPLETPSPRLGRLIGAGKPIRPGAVTRGQVIERLGEPDWRSSEDASLIYTSWVEGGYWFMFPFIPISPATHIVAARLDFDTDGVLRHTRIERGRPTRASLLTTRGPYPPPMVRNVPWPQAQLATRPTATAPARE